MQTRGYQSLLPGRYPLFKIVLSQAPQQRVTLLSSEAGIQPQLSFNLLCRCSPTHLVFFSKIKYRLIILQIYPSHIACVGNQARIFFCKLFPQAMLQFGVLGVDGSIEISVSVIVTVSH